MNETTLRLRIVRAKRKKVRKGAFRTDESKDWSRGKKKMTLRKLEC